MAQDCPQALYHHINSKLRRIANGYEIIHQEADGCDEYGIKYWVECKNDWSGRSWDISEALFYSQKTYLNQLVLEGLSFGGEKYYFHPDIVFGDTLKYKLISPEEHKIYLEIYNKLANIRERICKNYNVYMKDKTYYRHVGPWYNNLEHHIFASGVINFKKSLVVIASHNYLKPANLNDFDYHKIRQLIKWAQLTKDEYIMLGLNTPNNSN